MTWSRPALSAIFSKKPTPRLWAAMVLDAKVSRQAIETYQGRQAGFRSS
jgi:hypothetical protein